MADLNKPIFCFIDDSSFELDVFRNHIAPAAPGIEFILGSTYGEVREALGSRHPCLFLLDLYGSDESMGAPVIPSLDELQAEAAGFKTLEQVYEGLDDFPGDKTNEFLKRLFNIANSWRLLFYRASRKAGQNVNYGLDNLSQARRDYPAAAASAYTRKSMIMDAVEAIQAGVDGLSLKPDGPDDQAIGKAASEAAPELIADWGSLVTERFSSYLKNLAGVLIQSGAPDQVPLLPQPGKLSEKARAVLGPGDVSFLEASASWWEYTGRDPIY